MPGTFVQRRRIFSEHFASALLQSGLLPGKAPSEARHLILFYNTMWGYPEDIPSAAGLPADVEVTTDLRRFREAHTVVFHVPTLGRIGRLRKPEGQIWVAWWMESDQHFPQLADPAFMSRFDLTMSHRIDADVQTPYFEYDEQEFRAEPRPKHALAAMFISGMEETSGRTAYATELMRHLEVHSYGRLLRNRRLADDRGWATKLETIAGYKFTLAFENAIADHYATEKLYQPLIAGSVPVYLGAPNVGRLTPAQDCYIDVTDFAGPRELAEHLLELDHDAEAYARHLAWKRRPFQPEFQALLEEQRTGALVRLCELVEPTR
jgi:Glycosyltransferase family 10 (fucosyltransferase) C-term/Fucosyltransferase, N-terminal